MIKGSVAAAAVDDVPPLFAAVAVSQVGLGNCRFVRLHDTGFAEIKILGCYGVGGTGKQWLQLLMFPPSL